MVRSSARINRVLAASFVWQALGLALYFFVQVAAARVAGIEEFGVFAYATACVMTAAILGKFGGDATIMRFGGEAWARGEMSTFRQLVAFCDRRAIGASAAATLLLLLYVLLIWIVSDRSELVVPILIGALAIPVAAISSLRQAALLSTGSPSAALLPEYLLRPLTMLVLVGAAWVVIPRIEADLLMVIVVLAFTASLVLGSRLLNSRIGKRTGDQPPSHADLWRKTAISMMLFAGAYQLLSQIDLLIAGTILASGEIGLYAASKQIALVGLLGLTAFQGAASPQIAAAHALGNRSELLRTVRKVALSGFVFAVAYSGLVIAFGEAVLQIFGSEFEVSTAVLSWLCIAQVINGFSGPAGAVAAMIGLQGQAALVYGATCLVGGLMIAFLASTVGVEGAAIALVLTTAAWSVALNLIIFRRLGHTTSLMECVQPHRGAV